MDREIKANQSIRKKITVKIVTSPKGDVGHMRRWQAARYLRES